MGDKRELLTRFGEVLPIRVCGTRFNLQTRRVIRGVWIRAARIQTGLRFSIPHLVPLLFLNVMGTQLVLKSLESLVREEGLQESS